MLTQGDLLMSAQNSCPLCGGSSKLLFTINDSPILLNSQYRKPEEAKAVARVNVAIFYCRGCHFAFNPDYLEGQVDYTDPDYNSNQMSSAAYREYVDGVVKQLVQKLGLGPGRQVLEVACGNGYFLHQLQSQGCRVLGFDPQYRGQFGLEGYVRRELFSGSDGKTFDLVVLRHSLEQLLRADEVLKSITQAMHQNSRLYIEFLDLNYAFWSRDLSQFSHERARYFSLNALGRLLDGHGLIVIEAFPLALGHYLGVLAAQKPEPDDLFQVFTYLNNEVRRYPKVVVWGIGSRAVSVISQLHWDSNRVQFGVDVDPNKQGKYIPVTGQKILSPAEAVAFQPDLVVVANAFYLEEIRSHFHYPCRFLSLDGRLV